jgi:hypothetical protein
MNNENADLPVHYWREVIRNERCDDSAFDEWPFHSSRVD